MRIRTKLSTPDSGSIDESKRLTDWRVWRRALRLHFVGPSVLPALLGGVMAWAQGYPVAIFHFALVVIGVTLNHFALNLLDDVLDYRQAVDLKKADEKNFFTGGSGVLPEGLLRDTQMLRAAVLFFTATALIGAYLTWVCGWQVLMLGLFGLASSIFYTAPPLRFGYRGLGELGLLVNFGPVIVLGAYYVQAQTLALEPLIISLAPGLMMWSMILINEIPDYEADRRGGKWNLVARFGKEKGMLLCLAGLVLAYAIIIIAASTGALSPFILLGLLSLPFAVRMFLVMKRHLNDPLQMTPANLAMIKVHVITCLALISAYLIEWLRL